MRRRTSSHAVEEDDNGEKVVSVSVKSGPNWQLTVSSNRVFHGRTKELESYGLYSCVWVLATKLKKG